MFSLRKIFVTQSFSCGLKRYSMEKMITDSKRIFFEAVSAVEPRTLIKNNVTVENDRLIVCEKEFKIDHNCYVVGFGKAVLGMAIEMERILGSHLVKGIVSVPTGIFRSESSRAYTSSGHGSKLMDKKARETSVLLHNAQKVETRIEYLEGAENNQADEAAERAARAIFELAGRLGEKDLLIVLISGGGSSLLPLPRAPVTLQEKTELIKLLSRRGADIVELNCVRKRLSQVKGGGLAVQAHPATVLALVLSDIIGDPLDYIASGPTVPDCDAPGAAAQIIEKYDLHRQLPSSIRSLLSARPRPVPATFSHVTNVVIGNNTRAAAAALAAAKRLGYQAHVISTRVAGDVCSVSFMYARLSAAAARWLRGLGSAAEPANCLREYKHILNVSDDEINEIFRTPDELGARLCFIAGGEPTVAVRGGGIGGRNQQLALQFAIDVNNALQAADERVKAMNISLLSCGTDGIDGPTDAAGAIGTNSLCNLAQRDHIEPMPYLQDNNCYHFYLQFRRGEYLLRTGHTGTNVMDVHILLINP